MNSFNDPLNNNDPEDKRGIFDEIGKPKENYWLLAYLFSPIKVFKDGDHFFIENNSDQKISIDKKVLLPKSKMLATQLIQGTNDNLYGETGRKRKLLFYHPGGRLTGCLYKTDETNIGSDQEIFIAEYTKYQNLKASNAKIHSAGRRGMVEIHPPSKNWRIEGIEKDSLRVLRPCRKPFYRER
jgi:hypothetical protein